jgi:hypothetical protein
MASKERRMNPNPLNAGRSLPPATPEEDAFMEQLRRRMESPEKPIPVEEVLAYLRELQNLPPGTPP